MDSWDDLKKNSKFKIDKRQQHEKQFYLDQAKKLKDNFNSKYPDYVYRRRPNNSRRKRRADGSTVGGGARFPSAGPGGGQGGGEQHHDDGGSTEFSGESPVDVPSLPSALSLGADPGQGHSHHGHGGLTPQPPPLGSQTHHLQHHHAQQQHPHQQQQHHHPQIFTRPLYPPAGGEPHHPAYDAGPTSAGSHSSTSSYGYAYGGAGTGNEDPLGAYHAPHSATLPRPHLWGNEPSPGHHSQQQQQHHPHSPGLEPLHAHHSTAYSPDEPSSTTSLWSTPSAGGLAPLHHAQGARFDPTRTGASVSAGVGPGAHSGWPMSLPGVSAQQQGGRPRSLTGSTAIGGAGQGGSKPELFSPQIPHRAWSNTPSSGSSASATSTAGVAPGLGLSGGGGGLGVGVGGAAGMQFSTLTAPFFPGTSGAPAGENRSTSTSPTLARDPYYTTSSTSSGGGRAEDAYDTSAPHSAYPISPISPPSSGSYFSGPPGPSASGNGTASSLYPPHAHSGGGGGHGGRGSGIQLPHPISTYNVSSAQRDLASPLSAGPASSVSHTGYWDRLNEGR